MRVAGLFSGIGGLELGFEREGFEVVAVCETDTFCQNILEKHFPSAIQLADVRLFSLEDFLARVLVSPDQPESSSELASSGTNSAELSGSQHPAGSSSKTSPTHGGDGCPKCGVICGFWDTLVCLFELEPLTWERAMNDRASSLLPTPTASSYGNSRGGGAGRVGKVRKSLNSLGIQHPEDWERMMGFPIGWTDGTRSETRRFPTLLPSSLEELKL